MFKFKLNELIYYIKDDKVHGAPVLSRMKVDNLHEDWDSTDGQRSVFKAFGNKGIYYSTCHGILSEEEVYANKEDLAFSLTK